ncbi:beta-galactosidase 14-like [Raphanus sativus]|uniref:Beta-galactosidase 14-like n=1 Tax=Raphanus sativus TaxID=3726 RepID=A0A6J0LLR0_RAPSA|nr:beta-galactosidase 14-like [Raphanus sativus]
MDTSYFCYRDYYILLLVLFYSSMLDLASSTYIFSDARGIKTDSNLKRFLSNSNHQHGKENKQCISLEADMEMMRVSCDESKDIITKINFADYGNPTDCEDNKDSRHGKCGAPATLRLVKKNCLGKHMCYIRISDEMFGPSHCKKDIKLTVEYTCTKA